jgi:hypothetical protein
MRSRPRGNSRWCNVEGRARLWDRGAALCRRRSAPLIVPLWRDAVSGSRSNAASDPVAEVAAFHEGSEPKQTAPGSRCPSHAPIRQDNQGPATTGRRARARAAWPKRTAHFNVGGAVASTGNTATAMPPSYASIAPVMRVCGAPSVSATRSLEALGGSSEKAKTRIGRCFGVVLRDSDVLGTWLLTFNVGDHRLDSDAHVRIQQSGSSLFDISLWQ